MYVDSIKLINYRNYKGLKVKLNPNLNLFLGDNAQGKTNLLEAIYICSMGKSYRTGRDKDLIDIKKDKAYVGVYVNKKDIDKRIEIKLERDKPKRARINKIEIDKISELYGQLNVVIFSPEDLKLIKEGPSQRRNFLNDEISQIRPNYRYNLSKYNKIINQRNNLLKMAQYDKNKIETIDVFDMQLVDIAAKILTSRIDFLKKLSKISKIIHKSITAGIEKIDLEYVSSFQLNCYEEEKIKNSYYNVLKKNLNADIEKGRTEFGPHRDDIKIDVNNIDIRTFGSQGQQRTAALSLKLAEVELIKEEMGEYPVLLLDDVLSELDHTRRKYLIKTFKDIQTIITSTDNIELEEISKKSKSVFYIKRGNISLLKEE
ncbi:DNA replication/repair protein RecF [Dethiothermospora halolimnae]|uniref:DNA replication/repair protein RecF n=1 Tax=Dethiothermospora halolimnae TaxID=3114390 RepID=UPI003CCBD975